MKTDTKTAAQVASICWELLIEVESRTDPTKDILNKRLVDDAFSILRDAGVTTASPKWAR